MAARFINYLLTPYLTSAAILSGTEYGEMSLVYAAIPFLNIIFTYGLETAYFRFSKTEEAEKKVYNTATVSLIASTALLTLVLILFNDELAAFIDISAHPEYFTYAAFIIAFDALSALAFARLRFEGRPVKFALVRIGGIIINIAFVVFFLSVCPQIQKEDPNSFIGAFYDPTMGVGYILIANLIQAVATFLFLSKEFFAFRWEFDRKLWKEIIVYAAPLIIVGFAGMINETFDRLMLRWWTPASSSADALLQVGIYSACYKLAILITLFIQAFRMGAEPFFFKQSEGINPQSVYARVMKFFVITICFMFLAVVLFLDIWKYFIQNEVLWEGLKVVPILLLANMFLGIYYNLSIWYKLSNRTMSGAWITLAGVVITISVNYLFIPKYGYMACAWATFLCYGGMMLISYFWGQKHYPIPYAWRKLVAYIAISVLLYGLYLLFQEFELGVWTNRGFAVILLFAFAMLILRTERKEFERLPYVGNFLGLTAKTPRR